MKHALLLALTILAVLPPTASAQNGGVEIGTDGGLQLTLPERGDNVTSIFAPASWVRIGFPISPSLGIEPVVSLNYASDEDASVTRFGLFPFLVYNFSDSRTDSPYLRVGAGLSFTDFDTNAGDAGVTRFGMGGGVGTRFGITDTFSIRLEGGFDHWFESDEDPSFNVLQLLLGFSVFVD